MKILTYHSGKTILRDISNGKSNRILVQDCVSQQFHYEYDSFFAIHNFPDHSQVQDFPHHKIWAALMGGADSWASPIQNEIKSRTKKIHGSADSGASVVFVNFELYLILRQFLYFPSIHFGI